MVPSKFRSVIGAVKKNILFSFLSEFAPIYPVYMILFRDRGYTFVQLSLLFVVWELSVVLLELPSGILADRWDKGRVLAIGMALKALGFCAWLASPSLAAAAVGFALWGAQEAFCSGARQALLYETLRDRGLESSYVRAAGISNAAATAAVALSLVAGGPLFQVSPGAALVVSILAAGLGAAAALSLGGVRKPDPLPRSGAGAGDDGLPEVSGSGLAASVRDFRKGLRDKRLALFLAAGCLSIAAYGTLDEFDGLWAMDRYGVPLAWVGVWGALRYGAEGAGSLAAGFLLKPGFRSGNTGTARAMGIAGAFLAASAFVHGLYGVPLYIGGYFLMSAVNVAFETRLQEAARDESRAGFLSLSSLSMTLCAMALAPLIGAAGDSGGLVRIGAVSGGIILGAALVLGGGTAFRRMRGGGLG